VLQEIARDTPDLRADEKDALVKMSKKLQSKSSRKRILYVGELPLPKKIKATNNEKKKKKQKSPLESFGERDTYSGISITKVDEGEWFMTLEADPKTKLVPLKEFERLLNTDLKVPHDSYLIYTMYLTNFCNSFCL